MGAGANPALLVGGVGGANRRHLRQKPSAANGVLASGLRVSFTPVHCSTSVAVLQPYLALAHLAGYPNISPSSANVYTLQLLISTAGGPTSVSATLAGYTRCIKAKSSQKNAKVIQFSRFLSRFCTQKKQLKSYMI